MADVMGYQMIGAPVDCRLGNDGIVRVSRQRYSSIQPRLDNLGHSNQATQKAINIDFRQLVNPPMFEATDHVLVFLDKRDIQDERELASFDEIEKEKRGAFPAA
jgi:hypothetical protein